MRPSEDPEKSSGAQVYNFPRVHQTLRIMPAMEARIAAHVLTVEETVGLLN